MSQRSVDVKIGADTSGFLTGISDVVAKLNVLNKQMLESQAATKKINQEMREYEKEQAKIQKEIKESGSATDEQKEKLAKLEQKLDDARSRAAELKTEQSKLKSEIKSASKELDEQTDGLNKVANAEDDVKQSTDEMKVSVEKSSDGFTVMKGAISNLVSDALNVAVDKFKEMSVSSEQALNSLQVKTGMSTEAVSELKDEMYAIYKDNFGDSLTDVADKIALVAQNIDESDPSKIKSITENAIGLSDAFGSDFEENLRGVNGLMTNMGLTADEAFDFIAKGSQNGLDKTHELTDNLAEYSQIWSQAGFSAEEMFSILQNGLDSGAYNLDKVNDFVKEFAISLSDGRIAENISSFSNESKNLFEEWKSGKATQADVFQSIISDLSNMTNQQEALTLASTVWSSLGEDNAMSVLTSLNKVNDKYTDVAGTMQEINDIQYNDAGSQIEALGRQFEVDILQPIVEKATPKIKEFITWLSDHLPEVTSALAGLITSVVTFKTATAAGNFLSSIINGFKQLTPAINAATTAQQTNNTVTAANPYVAVASAILGIVAATATWINTNYKAVDAIGDVNKLTEELEKNAAQQRQTVDIEIEQINSLNTVYDELRNKTSLTADEKSTLASVSEELAGKLGIEESNLKGVDGKYKDLTKSIDDYIKKAHQRVELSIIESSWEDVGKELESTKQELKKFLQDKGYSEGDLILDHSDAATAHQYQEKINLFEEKIKEYKNQYDALLRDSQETQETMTVSEALNAKNSSDATDKATNSIKNKTTATQQSTKSTQEETEAVEELTKTMSELTSKTTAVTNAESEYKETGKLTVSTLQTIIDKYPDLENEVYKYMLNLEDAKTLIKSMKNTYQDDLTSYISVITQKAGKSNTFYNELINANASFVNAAKEQYGIDLINFKNLQEAKQAMIAVEKSKIDKGWGNSTSWSDKFDLAGNLSKFNDVMNKYGDANTYLANQAVERFINNSLSATTNYLNLFDKTTDKIKKTANEGKKATDKASKAEDTLLKKYELVEAAYNRLVDKRIERIQKEQEAKEKAKNAAIAAIDAEVEARKRLNEDKESQNELDTINARLKYEKLDELSRRELMRRKQELLNEQAETKWQRMMSDKKDKLQSNYDSYKNNSDSMIDALQRAANSAADYFDTLKNGYKTNSYIVNNNSDTRNIQIIQNALSNQQMVDKLLKAIYSK
ncbi:phage tail tape measure protein [Pseudoruminococcus massiliensis]|uniref:phage tail tape measure protein n=1 Tax=Pseudoruminococcus massiliensis TaxID=2086583 RepID=UPI00399F810F